jgi:sugar phosphate isomerase/epimerase
MSHKISRRGFGILGSSLVLGGLFRGALTTQAVEPFHRKGSPRLKLSLAAYSFRDYFKTASHKRTKIAPESEQIDMFQFIDYCADHGCDGAELTSYYFPADLTREYMLKIKHHAFMRGISLSGTAIGNTFTPPAGEKRQHEISNAKQWIDRAALMGLPHIRVFAGTLEKGQSAEEAKKNCIETLKECCEYAADKGVFLGIENHGGIVAEPETLLDIIHSVESPWLGINLDTANFHTADPYADIAKCAPYAVNVQFKTEVHPKGKKTEPADFQRLVKIFREANYQGYVAVEYEAAEDPKTAVPRALSELSKLLRAES